MFLLSSCLNLTLFSADLIMHSALYAFHSFPLPGREEVEGDQHLYYFSPWDPRSQKDLTTQIFISKGFWSSTNRIKYVKTTATLKLCLIGILKIKPQQPLGYAQGVDFTIYLQHPLDSFTKGSTPGVKHHAPGPFVTIPLESSSAI